ncbi:MAG: FmdE family protein [Dehalococcoidia bacterium]|nr:FmdE family protein [Dehalococcoidia bacterium]
MEENLDSYLAKAKALHGDCCAGIVLGTRLSLAALRALGLDPTRHHKNLIVFVEIDRCMTDAVQAITGCTLGHRTLKYVNYGKFGAIFYDLDSKRAVRVTERWGPREHAGEDISAAFRSAPDEELVNIEEVCISLDKKELPGKPDQIEECAQCGELVFDGRSLLKNNKRLCLACAEGPYYTVCPPTNPEKRP